MLVGRLVIQTSVLRITRVAPVVAAIICEAVPCVGGHVKSAARRLLSLRADSRRWPFHLGVRLHRRLKGRQNYSRALVRAQIAVSVWDARRSAPSYVSAGTFWPVSLRLCGESKKSMPALSGWLNTAMRNSTLLFFRWHLHGPGPWSTFSLHVWLLDWAPVWVYLWV